MIPIGADDMEDGVMGSGHIADQSGPEEGADLKIAAKVLLRLARALRKLGATNVEMGEFKAQFAAEGDE